MYARVRCFGWIVLPCRPLIAVLNHNYPENATDLALLAIYIFSRVLFGVSALVACNSIVRSVYVCVSVYSFSAFAYILSVITLSPSKHCATEFCMIFRGRFELLLIHKIYRIRIGMRRHAVQIKCARPPFMIPNNVWRRVNREIALCCRRKCAKNCT